MITYKIQKTRNPKYPTENYFHGVAVKTGELNFDKLAKRINNSTTVTQSDCYAVLKSMKEHIVEALTEGQVVVLDDLGRFQVSLQGKSYNAETMQDEEFKPAEYIKGSRIVFRPEVVLNRELKREMTLKRVSSEALA